MSVSADSPVEFIMAGVSKNILPPDGFPDHVDLLKHPDIWVADSATTVHNTSHRTGVINARDESHAIVMGDGSELSTKIMGDIKATVCDCKGNQKFSVKLTDVVVHPDGHFNLFSTSKLQKEGWVLGGDKEAMWLSKDGATIRFDILISTPKANFYGAYLKHKLEMTSVGKSSECLTVNQAHGRLGHTTAHVKLPRS